MIVLLLISIVGLIVIAGVSLKLSHTSRYERERQQRLGHQKRAWQRTALIAELVSLQRVTLAILLVSSSIAALASFGWWLGSGVALLIALFYGAVARQAVIVRLANWLYGRYESAILNFVTDHPSFVAVIRTPTVLPVESRLGSHDELLYLIGRSGDAVSSNEKTLIRHAITFADKTVVDYMTPRRAIDTVKKGELLGPLVLDDLHKTGHSRIPVIDGDIDHIVGVLQLGDALELDTSRKHTAKVDSVMERPVLYIHEQQNLQQALSAFLRTHHHLFIVVNTARQTTGIITLEDVMEALLGRKITDELTAHDDLHHVAARLPDATKSAEPHRS